MNLRIAFTTFALALVAGVLNSSTSCADDVVANQTPLRSIGSQVAQLRDDIAADVLACVELSGRIDELVAGIDLLLDHGAGNRDDLLRYRKIALALRSRIKCDHSSTDDSAAEQGAVLAGAACTCGGSDGAVVPVLFNAPGSGFIGNLFGGGGGGFGGGGGGGGGGGFGSLFTLGALTAAIAVPIAVSNNGDGGDAASTSK